MSNHLCPCGRGLSGDGHALVWWNERDEAEWDELNLCPDCYEHLKDRKDDLLRFLERMLRP